MLSAFKLFKRFDYNSVVFRELKKRGQCLDGMLEVLKACGRDLNSLMRPKREDLKIMIHRATPAKGESSYASTYRYDSRSLLVSM
jgi:hypothetical protein